MRVKRLLTPKEVQILELLSVGTSNKEISARVHLSVSTVPVYLHRMCELVDANNRLHLAVKYIKGELNEFLGYTSKSKSATNRPN